MRKSFKIASAQIPDLTDDMGIVRTKRRKASLVSFATLCACLSTVVANSVGSQIASLAESLPPNVPSNVEGVPRQILRSGVNLHSQEVSANSRQLSDILNLTPLLTHIQTLRSTIDPTNFEPTLANVAASQQLTASVVKANGIIQKTDLEIDYVMAEITAEQNIYSSVLANYSGSRDRAVLRTNALSFITNGALWAVGEALDIPTNTHPNYSVSSGIFGVLAGLIPSVASGYALYQLNGKKTTSEQQPNMLSKVFEYPIINSEIEYPGDVWSFLKGVPAGQTDGKTRKELLIERWVADKNIPDFTAKTTKLELDVITANVPHKKALTIGALSVRQSMLQQLSAEILKMKRLLLELSMVVQGDKQI